MKIKTETYQEFYQLMCYDTTIIDGQSKSNVIDCILYVDFQQKKIDNTFIMNIERFRYELDSSHLQQAELDLWKRLATLSDKVSLLLDDRRKLIGIIDIDILQNKAREICKDIALMYKGKEMENLLKNIINIYLDEELLMLQFRQYNLFGCLLLQLSPHNMIHEKSLNTLLCVPGYDVFVNSCIQYIYQQNNNQANRSVIKFRIKEIVNNSEQQNFKLQKHAGNVTFSSLNGSILSLHIKTEFVSDIQVEVIRECKIRQLKENDLIYLL